MKPVRVQSRAGLRPPRPTLSFYQGTEVLPEVVQYLVGGWSLKLRFCDSWFRELRTRNCYLTAYYALAHSGLVVTETRKLSG